jgi:predicted TIM-barrel fold metal-dependent hydrolase
LAVVARDMPVVIDHMLHIDAAAGVGHPSFAALLRMLGDGLCWVKLSGAYRLSQAYPDYPDARPFHHALLRANPDRLLWGTDWPHPQVAPGMMPNDGHLLDLFNAWTPDASTRYRILVRNPAELYFAD